MRPDLSIILPYFNKAYEFKLLLQALDSCGFDKEKLEIIIIDDGSPDDVRPTIEDHPSLRIAYHRRPHTGNRAQVRNSGASMANSDRLLFLDCDMIPGPEALNELERLTARDPKTVALGVRWNTRPFDRDFLDEKTVANDFDILANLPAIADERVGPCNYERDTGLHFDGGWQFCYSHSLCLWKEAFMAVGGFDEVFSANWGAEDVELGYRLYRHGCSFTLAKDAVFYHLYHPVDIAKNLLSLKKNYSIFLAKHPHWSVELLIREFEMWGVETINLQEEIKSRKFLVTRLPHVERILPLIPDGTLLVGIEVDPLLECPRVRQAFIPESRNKGGKVKDLPGFQTGLPDGSFELALVSAHYHAGNNGLGVLLDREIRRIAKRVVYLTEGDDEAEAKLSRGPGSAPIRIRPLLFCIPNDFTMGHTRHYYSHLAVAAARLGIETGFQLIYDTRKKIDVNSGYLKLKSGALDHSELLHLRDHTLNFMGDEVPCIMESSCSVRTTRSLGCRIFWEDFGYRNSDRAVIRKSMMGYSRAFAPRRLEGDALQGLLRTDPLKYGACTHARAEPRTGGPFRFLWSDRFTRERTNLEHLLEAFSETFGHRNDVECRVALSGNAYIVNDNDYYSVSLDRMAKNYGENFVSQCNAYQERLMRKYREYRNIVFVPDKACLEDCLEELASCDAFVSIEGGLEIHPLVLESLAMGKRPIVLDTGAYEGYGDKEHFRTVKSIPISAALAEGSIESPDLDQRDSRRYLLAYRPSLPDLCATLETTFREGRGIGISETERSRFVREHDWMHIAERLRSLLK